MIKIKAYYQTEADLQRMEEPYKSVAKIIDKLYLKGPKDKLELSYKEFKNTLAISCIRFLAEDLANNQVSFVNRLKTLWTSLLNPRKVFTNSYDSYSVSYQRYQGTIFGGVYYVMKRLKSIDEEHLEMMENYISTKNDAFPYFNVFKDELKSTETIKEHSTMNKPKNLAELRKQFIQNLNNNPGIVNEVNWADVTIAFDREVMTELFWGIEDDNVLKSVCSAIISTWNKLYEKKDHRCMEKKGLMATSIDPWKFGGMFKESIDIFFKNLWIERNAQNAYTSFGNITDTSTTARKVNQTVHGQKTDDRIQKSEMENTQLLKENEKLKTENKQLKEQVKQLEEATTEAPQQQLETEIMNSIENIPRLKLLWQLMKLDGAEVEHRNNQKIAMQIMQTVTGIPYDSCKKIWKREDAPIKRQQKMIVELNTWMKSIGMKIQL